jgi:hypothetical protein
VQIEQAVLKREENKKKIVDVRRKMDVLQVMVMVMVMVMMMVMVMVMVIMNATRAFRRFSRSKLRSTKQQRSLCGAAYSWTGRRHIQSI